MDPFTIAGKVFSSRLLIGTAAYPNHATMLEAIGESGAEITTVAIRRINLKKNEENTLLDDLSSKHFLLPNTAGCYTAKEAVLTAQLAREALETNWIKLEVIGDEKTLLPDVVELLKAAYELVREGFVVLPYCNDDLISCQKLAGMGCAAVMPLGSPIGSGMGICNPYNLQLLRKYITIPIIVDAGIGTSSDVVSAMEIGADAVLVDSAIARAEHPIHMARAMRLATEAGRLAYLAGRIPRKHYAIATSPTKGVIDVATHHVSH